MDETGRDDVETKLERDTVSATTTVDAAPADVFEFLRQPANHAVLSGDSSVREAISGPDRLGPDDRFGMKMRIGVPYRVKSKVVEFEQDRRIAWCHFGGHRWRWDLEALPDGRTRVTETFDQSTALFPPGLRLAGFPRRHESNVADSVANLAAHFAGDIRP